MDGNSLVRFSPEDLQLFSEASGDRNPLHMSAEYASRTAYGQQVVFGVLGCIASLGAVRDSDDSIQKVTVDFQRPMFVGIDYSRAVTESRDGEVVRLLDGSTPVLTTSVKFATESRSRSQLATEASFGLRAPRVLAWEDLARGQQIEGSYRSDPAALAAICERWGLTIDPIISETLLWASYFVGMEMPGRNALFFRVALEFHHAVASDATLHFKATINSLNQSIAQARSTFELRSGQALVASGQIISFVRPEMPALRLPESAASRQDRLSGKVAVILGASRGLGAALAMTLAGDGAKVIAVARSAASWLAELPIPVRDRITFWEGDASAPDDMEKLRAMINGRFHRLDFIVCSAFPAIPSLRLERNASKRIQDYVDRATKLVVNPLCHLLSELAESQGCAILISSIAVEKPVRDWPHYVAAKAAAEAFFRVAPMQFPEVSALIIRPERLLTEMTNTPMGRQGATLPLVLAQQISDALETPRRTGSCEVLELAAQVQSITLEFTSEFKRQEALPHRMSEPSEIQRMT